MYRKPPALKQGDVVAVVAPSGAVDNTRVNHCRELLAARGFIAKVADDIKDSRGYLAGASDQARAEAFVKPFLDEEVKGVICARGGYGAMRMLPLVNWDPLKATPKFFCGFSDITALHLAIRKETGLVTWHGGPMPRISRENGANQWNDDNFFAAMTATGPLGVIPCPSGADIQTLAGGAAEGIIEGGNLTLLASLTGTNWQLSFRDRLLLVEDVNEAPYRIDRSLTQLLLSGALDGVRGIVFGDSPTCEKSDGDEGFTLKEVIVDRLGGLGVPLVYGFPCGHADFRATIPLGARARLDANNGTLEILE